MKVLGILKGLFQKSLKRVSLSLLGMKSLSPSRSP